MHSHFLAANRAMMPAETAWYQTPIYMPTFLRHHHKKIVGANSVDGSRRITIARPEGGGLKTVTTGREVPIHCRFSSFCWFYIVWLALQLTMALSMERIGTDCEIRCLHLFLHCCSEVRISGIGPSVSFCT
ncbi:hypothetical protein PHAVU_002G226250 [Phaseolus vulgaris]